MVHKIYEFEGHLGETLDYLGYGPDPQDTMDVRIEAESYQAAEERAEEIVRAEAKEQSVFPWDVGFEGMYVADVAPIEADLQGQRYCPEHGKRGSWVYDGGKRYCRDCGSRLIALRDQEGS